MACLYGDDGEMQCGRFFPSLDFRRDSEAAILEGIQIHNQRRWTETQAKPVPERTAEMPLRAILNHLRDEDADYLIGRCIPLIQILAHEGNKQAKEVLSEIKEYCGQA
jgi:hypothetical protein